MLIKERPRLFLPSSFGAPWILVWVDLFGWMGEIISMEAALTLFQHAQSPNRIFVRHEAREYNEGRFQ